MSKDLMNLMNVEDVVDEGRGALSGGAPKRGR